MKNATVSTAMSSSSLINITTPVQKPQKYSVYKRIKAEEKQEVKAGSFDIFGWKKNCRIIFSWSANQLITEDKILPFSGGGSGRWRWTSLAECWRWWRGMPSRWRIHWGRTSQTTMWAPTDKVGQKLPTPTTCEKRKKNDIKCEKAKPQRISS